MNMKKIAGNVICAVSGVFLLWIFLSWLAVITVDAYSQYNFFYNTALGVPSIFLIKSLLYRGLFFL